MRNGLLRCLATTSCELRDLDVGSHVPRVRMADLDALTFATEFVARNRPVVITGALDAWNALHSWDEAYLVAKAGAMPVTVDVTPNGRGDAVTWCRPCCSKRGEAVLCAAEPGVASTSAAAVPGPDAAETCHGMQQLMASEADTGGTRGAVSGSPLAKAAAAEGWSGAPGASPSGAFGCAGAGTAAGVDAMSLHEERCGTAAAGTDVVTAPPPPEGGSQMAAGAGTGPASLPPEGGFETAAGAAGPGPAPPLHEGGVEWFVTPDERRMTLAEFFRLLRASRAGPRPGEAGAEVPYIQHQNSSLTAEYGFLEADIQPGLAWADRVFGGPPEATNLWIGDERSVTSFHKDHYENLYAVLAGTKVFTLLPPCDVWRMHLHKYPTACWTREQDGKEAGSATAGTTGLSAMDAGQAEAGPCGRQEARQAGAAGGGTRAGTGPGHAGQQQGQVPGGLGERQAGPLPPEGASVRRPMRAVLKEPAEQVPWCAIDPRPADKDAAARRFLHFFDPSLPEPLVVEVGPGELLYLPSMWHHYVEQRATSPVKDFVMAVNFWYDMRFDVKYAYYKLVESLAVEAGLLPDMQG